MTEEEIAAVFYGALLRSLTAAIEAIYALAGGPPMD